MAAKSKLFGAVLVVVCTWLVGPASCFWEVPHMLVAEVARQELEATNEAHAAEYLGSLYAGFYPNEPNFTTGAVWPDSIKPQSRQYNEWHYIDFPIADGVDPSTTIKPGVDNQIVWALTHTAGIMRDTDNIWEKGAAIRFFAHFCGDIHQPLHCASRFTPDHPKGDEGGNKVHIDDPAHGNNLHYFWDAGAGSYDAWNDVRHPDAAPTPVGVSYPSTREYSAARFHAGLRGSNKTWSELMVFLGGEAARLRTVHPGSSLPQLQAGGCNYTFWAHESFQLAQSHVYVAGVAGGQPLPDGYVDAAQSLLSQQIPLAGYRLAHCLRGILGQSGPYPPKWPHTQPLDDDDAESSGVWAMLVGVEAVVIVLLVGALGVCGVRNHPQKCRQQAWCCYVCCAKVDRVLQCCRADAAPTAGSLRDRLAREVEDETEVVDDITHMGSVHDSTPGSYSVGGGDIGDHYVRE